MLVQEWMSKPALYVTTDIPVEMALGFFESHGLHRAPVLEEGRLVGMVSKDDLVRAVRHSVQARRRNLEVGDVMAKCPAWVRPESTMEDAAQMMIRRKAEALPVTLEGRLVGILTKSDFFWAFCALLNLEPRSESKGVAPGDPEGSDSAPANTGGTPPEREFKEAVTNILE